MPAKRKRKSKARSDGIHSTRLHLVMYSVLLVATPFIMVTNFLQDAIGQITKFTCPVGGMDVPTVPAVAFIIVLVLVIAFRAHLTRLRILAIVIGVLMIALAQQITDHYAGHKFYDLQQNWHYFAYTIFAFMMYRDLIPRRVPLTKIMLLTYLFAMLYSSFDETFQRFMSSRTFDLSDVAKDVWGTLIGMVLILFGGKKSREFLKNWTRLRYPRLRDYTEHPFILLILLTVLTFVFLCYSSLLSGFDYWSTVVLLTICSFPVIFLLFHISQYKWGKYGLLAVFVLALITQSYFYLKHRQDYIVHNEYGLTIYKGIPIVFFDVLIFPNGMFRLVDKKHDFNYRDRTFLMMQRADIIVVGSGAYGKGGNGFTRKVPHQFIYNPFIQRGTQVIILKNGEACETFNRLKREGKKVLFVLHNTC